VQRSIATSAEQPPQPGYVGRSVAQRLEATIERAGLSQIGLFFVILALGIYLFSDPVRSGLYNHFVWQADAFLHGRFAIAYPVSDGPYTNAYFQDVMRLPSAAGSPSYGLLPFPPLPAVVLLPFVAIFGLATDSQLVGVVIGAINVGLAWRMTTRLTTSHTVSFLATLFFAFGTVHWYAAMLSTTWYLAHVVATTFVLLGITLALDGERREQARVTLRRLATSGQRSPSAVVAAFEGSSLFLDWYRRLRGQVEPLQFVAGFVFGVAALARLTTIFAAPFFVFVGGGGSYWRRGFSAALGAVIPVGALLVYNLVSTGHVFNPAYEYLYQTEYLGYMPAGLEINTSYGIEDLRHVPLNLLIMLGWPPVIQPECGLALLRPDCAPLQPSQIGMSLLLTSPAYLLAVPVVLLRWRERLVMGATIAVLAVALVNLMHFSQGWVQFGYRFSNDFVPFALILVTLAIAQFRLRWLAVLLIGLSVLVNAWGVYWGVTLGW